MLLTQGNHSRCAAAMDQLCRRCVDVHISAAFVQRHSSHLHWRGLGIHSRHALQCACDIQRAAAHKVARSTREAFTTASGRASRRRLVKQDSGPVLIKLNVLVFVNVPHRRVRLKGQPRILHCAPQLPVQPRRVVRGAAARLHHRRQRPDSDVLQAGKTAGCYGQFNEGYSK